MKIVQINCVYNTGSTGKIVKNIHESLVSLGHQSYVLYGRGSKQHESNVFKVSTELEAKIHSLMSRLFGVEFGFSYFSTKKTINIIKRIKPDVVHLHCLNGHFVNVYKLVKFLKKNNIKTVLTLHAEIMHTAGCEHALNCEKWKTGCSQCKAIKGWISHLFRDDAKYCFHKIRNAFKDFKFLSVVSVSPWLMKRAQQSLVFRDTQHFVVQNGVDVNVFRYRDYSSEKKRLFGDRKICTFVLPAFNDDPNHLKGGFYLLKIAERMPNVLFLIIGNFDRKKTLPRNVSAVGRLSDQFVLSKYYSMSDATLILSKRETFSMVAAESLCSGTPVVGFKAGGPESIAIFGFASFVDYSDVDSLEKALIAIFEKRFDKEFVSKQASSFYSKEKMVRLYEQIYRELIERKVD